MLIIKIYEANDLLFITFQVIYFYISLDSILHVTQNKSKFPS